MPKSRNEVCGKVCYFQNTYGRHCFTNEDPSIFKNCPCITCIISPICNHKICDELFEFLFSNIQLELKGSYFGPYKDH